MAMLRVSASRAQPVPGVLALRDDHLEGAVRLDVHLLLVHRGAGARSAAAEAGTGEQVEADPLRVAPGAPDPVVVLPVERGAEVVVVRVLTDDLDRLVARADRAAGSVGAAVLELALERAAQQAGEHAEALGAIERVVGVALGEDDLAGVGEQVAELAPRGAVDDLLGDLVHGRCSSRRRGRRSGRCRRRTARRSTARSRPNAVGRVAAGAGAVLGALRPPLLHPLTSVVGELVAELARTASATWPSGSRCTASKDRSWNRLSLPRSRKSISRSRAVRHSWRCCGRRWRAGRADRSARR